MAHLSSFVIRRRNMLLMVNILFSLGITDFLPANTLNDEFVKYFDRAVAFRTATNFLNENMGGIYTLEFSIRGSEAGAVNEPGFLIGLPKFLTGWRHYLKLGMFISSPIPIKG